MQIRVVIPALLSLLVLGAGCGVIRLGELDPPEGRQMVIGVSIEGNEAVSDGDIADGLATYEDNLSVEGDKPLLDRAKLPVDAQRIESYYAARGFFDARVTDYDVVEVREGLVRVRFTVEEGPPARVTERAWTTLVPEAAGDPEAPARLRDFNEEIPDLVRLEEGDVWTSAAHEATKKALKAALQERGFLFAEVLGDVFVTPATDGGRSARLRYHIAPGPLARMGDIRVTGNRRIPTERILRRVGFEQGDIVEPARLRKTEQDIYALRVFFGVRAEPRRPTLDQALDGRAPTFENIQAIVWNPHVPIEIKIQEMPTQEVETGVGAGVANQRSEVYALGGYRNRNLFGGVRYFEAEARPMLVVLPSFWDKDPSFSPAGTADLAFRQPAFLEEYIELSLRSGYELGVEPGYQSHEVSLSPALSRRFFGILSLTLSYEFQYLNYFNYTGLLQLDAADTMGLAFRDEYFLAYLGQSVELDLRDSIFNPRRGAYAALRLQESIPELGSDFRYLRLSGDLRGYISPLSWFTIAARFGYGQTFPLSGDTPLPARFTAGGPNDMRGFGAGRMGPFLCKEKEEANEGTDDVSCGSAKVFTGGELLLEASLELRFLLPANFGLVAFTDVGEVWASKEGLDWRDFNVAVGPGLRYYTPFGPIRADFGVLVTDPEPGRFQFHISIGQAF